MVYTDKSLIKGNRKCGGDFGEDHLILISKPRKTKQGSNWHDDYRIVSHINDHAFWVENANHKIRLNKQFINPLGSALTGTGVSSDNTARNK